MEHFYTSTTAAKTILFPNHHIYIYIKNLITTGKLVSTLIGILSTTKFENYFSLFENIAKNLQKEYSILNKMFAEAFSCVKDAATELLRIWECLYNYFILKRIRSVILSNLQTDNSIHVTSPDNGRVALILNKADYYTKVNAILSDGYKIQFPSN